MRPAKTLPAMDVPEAGAPEDTAVVMHPPAMRTYRNSWCELESDGTQSRVPRQPSRIPMPRANSALHLRSDSNHVLLPLEQESMSEGMASTWPETGTQPNQYQMPPQAPPLMPSLPPPLPATLISAPSQPLQPPEEQLAPAPVPQAVSDHATSVDTSRPRMNESDLAEAAANTAQVLRVDLTDPNCYDEATDALRHGNRALEYLLTEAGRTGRTEAAIWRGTLAVAPAASTAGCTVMVRTPTPHTPAERKVSSFPGPGQHGMPRSGETPRDVADMADAAVRLKNILRLSICDDADLWLVRRVVGESLAFLEDLGAAAAERGVRPSQLWNALDALER